MAGTVLGHTEVEGRLYAAFPNSKAGDSGLKHVIDYADKSGGVFRIIQTLDKTLKAAEMALAHVGSSFSGSFDHVTKKLTSAWTAFAIPRLFQVTESAYEVVQNLTSDEPCKGLGGCWSRETRSAVAKLADCFATWGYSFAFVAGRAPHPAVEVATLVKDTTDLWDAGEDFCISSKHLEYVEKNNGDVALQTRFKETAQEAMLRVIKLIASAVSGVLGLLVLGFGGPVLPAALLLLISLVSSAAAISAHFYKETMQYEVVSFFKAPKVLTQEGVGIY